MDDDDRLIAKLFMLLSAKVSDLGVLAAEGQNRLVTGGHRAEITAQIRNLAEEIDILSAIGERLMTTDEPSRVMASEIQRAISTSGMSPT